MCDESSQPLIDDAADIAPVVEFWKSLDLPGLIDVHTHFMPKRVMDKVWQYFDSAGPLTARPWPITYRHDEQARLDRLRGYGVRAFTALVYPHKPQMAAWLNQWGSDFARDKPDCLQTATLYPEPGVGDYVREAIERGARVFKSHVQVGDYDPSDPLLDPGWSAISEASIPVVMHCGAGPVPGRFTNPETVGRVLRKHPRLRVIVAHMGMSGYSEFLDLAERHPTIYFDTSGAFTPFTEETAPFPPAEHRRLADLGDRILFGSDFPNIAYNYATGLRSLADLGLGEDWLRAVCFTNAAELFGLR